MSGTYPNDPRPSQEEPPAQPSPTHQVDPENPSLYQGAQEQGPQAGQETTASNAGATGEQRFSAEDIENARKEEKDKLYGRINEMSEELKQIREERETERKKQEEAEKAKTEQKQKKEEEEMDVRSLIERKEQEWQERFNQLQSEYEKQQAMLEKEREFTELQQYRQDLLDAHEEEVMPELRDLVDGSTREEMDQSLENAKTKTQQILQQVQQHQQEQNRQQPGTRVTAPAMGPVEETEAQQEQLTPENIREMPISEYKKNRDKIMNAVRNRAQTQGIYQ